MMTVSETNDSPAAVKNASTAVDEASSRVVALARAEVDRYQQLGPAKERLLAAQNTGDFKKAAVIREEVEYLENSETRREERRAAITGLHLLRAQELEERATALRKEVEARQATAKEFLAHLNDQENTELEIRSRYFNDRTATQQMAADATAMEVEARQLRRQAKHGEVTQEGRVHGETAEELIEGLMRMPEVIGPTIASIYEWVFKCRGRRQGKSQRMQMVFYVSKIAELDWHGIVILDDRPKPKVQG
jgi:uncharacterized small protein (DUF1192 family)